MNKKWKIASVVLSIAAIYLFLFVAVPALERMVYTPEFLCGDGEARYKTPWVLSTIPGLIGLWWIVVILKQKKEIK